MLLFHGHVAKMNVNSPFLTRSLQVSNHVTAIIDKTLYNA
jgi:hypothetical protein